MARLELFANTMCHFDHECHCFGLCVNCFENVEFELTAASKQSRKTVICSSYGMVSPYKCCSTLVAKWPGDLKDIICEGHSARTMLPFDR